MSACERCWADADLREYHRGGRFREHLEALLAERTDNPCPQPPTVRTRPWESAALQGEAMRLWWLRGHEQHTEGEGE